MDYIIVLVVVCFIIGLLFLLWHEDIIEKRGSDTILITAAMSSYIACGSLFTYWCIGEQHINGQYIIQSISKYKNEYQIKIDRNVYMYLDSCLYKVGDTLYIKK